MSASGVRDSVDESVKWHGKQRVEWVFKAQQTACKIHSGMKRKEQRTEEQKKKQRTENKE